MIVGYQYVAMLVTGAIHLVLGFCGAITAIAGMAGADFVGKVIRIYCGVALFSSMWILMVGVLGITSGLKRFADETTRKLKIGYLVTAILSACIFCLVGLAMFCCTFVSAKALNEEWARYITLGHVGSVIMALEFVLAIVSSSICCCCSTSNTTTTVITQAPAGQAVPAVQYQSPPIYQPGAPVNNP